MNNLIPFSLIAPLVAHVALAIPPIDESQLELLRVHPQSEKLLANPELKALIAQHPQAISLPLPIAQGGEDYVLVASMQGQGNDAASHYILERPDRAKNKGVHIGDEDILSITKSPSSEALHVELNDAGSIKIQRLTTSLTKGSDRIAMLVKGRVCSAPVVSADLSRMIALSGLSPSMSEALLRVSSNKTVSPSSSSSPSVRHTHETNMHLYSLTRLHPSSGRRRAHDGMGMLPSYKFRLKVALGAEDANWSNEGQAYPLSPHWQRLQTHFRGESSDGGGRFAAALDADPDFIFSNSFVEQHDGQGSIELVSETQLECDRVPLLRMQGTDWWMYFGPQWMQYMKRHQESPSSNPLLSRDIMKESPTASLVQDMCLQSPSGEKLTYTFQASTQNAQQSRFCFLRGAPLDAADANNLSEYYGEKLSPERYELFITAFQNTDHISEQEAATPFSRIAAQLPVLSIPLGDWSIKSTGFHWQDAPPFSEDDVQVKRVYMARLTLRSPKGESLTLQLILAHEDADGKMSRVLWAPFCRDKKGHVHKAFQCDCCP